MISEMEARKIVLGLGAAMMKNDKEAREMLYADLDPDSLRRIIRWSMRMSLDHFFTICAFAGLNPEESWQHMSLMLHLAEGEMNDE